VNRPEIVGGYAREFFMRVGKHYGEEKMVWHIEPHVAEKIFTDMAAEAHVKVIAASRLREHSGVQAGEGHIISIATESGETYTAKVFIDASYEGDLMTQAGVKFRVGRESTREYGEAGAGVRTVRPSGHPGIAVDEQGVLPLVYAGAAGEFGAADEKVQCYNFRLCLTRRADNRVAIDKPAAYDPRDYEILARLIAAKPAMMLKDILTISPIRNDKTDINNGFAGVSTDLHNANWGYPNGSYAERAKIWQRYRDYTLGLLWLLGNDPRVPQALRDETLQWGLAKDEFTDNENFPHQLYIREGRRMIGEYVMTEKDCRDENEKDDSIAMGSYMMDCHGVQRVLMPRNDYAIEGSIGGNNRILPYEIPYRALVSKKSECSNLIVPLCMSASHVAWSSIRMEPQFMLMGHAAGVAAAMAAHDGAAVQEIDASKLRERLKAQGQVLRWKMPGAIEPKTLAGVVVDDWQAKYVGAWKSSNAVGPFVGNCYRYSDRDSDKHSARFTPSLKTGRYTVVLFYAAASNRATNVRVTVHHANGDDIVELNQKQPSAEGRKTLGIFDFADGDAGFVEIAADNADGVIVADAVQFLPITE
jgi:hypothetical protein